MGRNARLELIRWKHFYQVPDKFVFFWFKVNLLLRFTKRTHVD